MIRNGSFFNDVYRAGVVVLLSFLSRHAFVKIDSCSTLRHHAEKIVNNETSDRHLVNIIKGTILSKENNEGMEMRELAVETMKIKWEKVE